MNKPAVNWLRISLVVYALAYLLGGYFLLRSRNQTPVIGAYLLGNGLIILLATVFERGRYKPKTKSTDGWELTGERFVDDVSGKHVRVRYNRLTGERDYVEEGPETKDSD